MWGVSTRTVFFTLISLLPAITAAIVLAFTGRPGSHRLWRVPGWLAAAALAPALSTFFGARLLIGAFQAMAMSGGGVAAVSAGMWEAMLPGLVAAYAAAALALTAAVVAIRAIVNADGEAPERTERKSAIGAASIVLLAIVALVSTAVLFRGIVSMVTAVIDPQAPQTGGIASTASAISTRLILTAGTSVLLTLVLFGVVLFTALASPQREPATSFATALAFVCVLILFGLLGHIALLHSWRAQLWDTAVTGTVHRG